MRSTCTSAYLFSIEGTKPMLVKSDEVYMHVHGILEASYNHLNEIFR